MVKKKETMSSKDPDGEIEECVRMPAKIKKRGKRQKEISAQISD
jgi:hypothetical protein